MNDESTEIKLRTVENDITEIKQQLLNLPDAITARMNETVELKISLGKADLEKKFYKAIAGVTGGLILEFVGMLLSLFLKK